MGSQSVLPSVPSKLLPQYLMRQQIVQFLQPHSNSSQNWQILACFTKLMPEVYLLCVRGQSLGDDVIPVVFT